MSGDSVWAINCDWRPCRATLETKPGRVSEDGEAAGWLILTSPPVQYCPAHAFLGRRRYRVGPRTQ